MSYTSFAVFGAGTIGSPIIAGLAAKPGISTVVIGRPGSKSLDNLPAGVKAAAVDTADVAAVAAVLKEHKVEVIVSAVGSPAVPAQEPLVKAAKEAGVKLFVPSEFGFPTEGHTTGFFTLKNKIADDLKAAGIPSVRIYVGLFTDNIPFVFGYLKDKKITVVGSGDVDASFTTVADITGFTVHVLTTLPPAQLENKTFRIQGERIKFNQLGALFNTTVVHADQVAAEPAALAQVLTGILLAADAGGGSSGWLPAEGKEGTGDQAAGSANHLWEGHHWTTIKEFHKL
ncbi:BHLH domain-containing protein [Mycena chlorophos]|uniref:BHLH domain-containing protein n=1 Tax=Mycena chlorophos TaxID=658473 RepID=A0A8H6W9P6_MYCCL|nr:BHLH domain-containing protein [Mycena chlorophos]